MSNQVTEECAASRDPPGIDYCDQFAMCSYLHYVTCIGGVAPADPDTRNHRNMAKASMNADEGGRHECVNMTLDRSLKDDISP